MTAKKWVDIYQEQYFSGIRTLPELIAAIIKTAGEFGAEETLASVNREFLSEIKRQVECAPAKDEILSIKSSTEDEDFLYAGLIDLRNLLFKD